MRRLCSALFALVGLSLVIPNHVAYSNDYSIVVNKENPESKLTASLLTRLLLRKRKKWDSGERVRPIYPPKNTPLFEECLLRTLDYSFAELERFWIQKSYSSGVTKPLNAEDDETTLKFVSLYPGAVGCIQSSSEQSISSYNVKVVEVVK